jgi:hypothetical protein
MKSDLTRIFFLITLILINSQSLFSQFKTEKVKPDVAKKNKFEINPSKSSIISIALSQEIDGLPPTNSFEKSKSIFEFNPSFKNQSEDVIRKTKQKIDNLKEYYPDETNINRTSNPNIKASFEGNGFNGYLPPDNNIAISHFGHIVSVTNSKIYYYNENGTLIYESSFRDFFSQQTYTPYDPKIIYDSEHGRFIMVVLEGTSSTHSKVKLCYSKQSDPSYGWWIYELDGDMTGDGYWFDYPNIGISNEEVFITGNLFNDAGYFQTAAIYQVQKQNGYNGYPISFLKWWNLGWEPFTLVPASYGQDGNYGPGFYLIKTSTFINANYLYYLYYVSGSIWSSPSINSYVVNAYYESPGNALQSGTSKVLDNGGIRVRSAFYLDGVIHFSFGSEYNSNNYSGINYNRLNVATLTNTSLKYGNDGYDYSYPSIASYGSNATDKSVMISFLRSGSTIFPEARVIHCDDAGNWSSSIATKLGETYIDMISSQTQRWGDYSDIVRKPGTDVPEVWSVGCYGKGGGYYHGYGTWIAQVTDAADEIIVNNPNQGNTWVHNEYYEIRWDDNIFDDVSIELYKGGVYNSTIQYFTESDGSDWWEVPQNLTAGNDYKIKISSTSNPAVYDFSDGDFTISEPLICLECPGANYTLTPESSWDTHWGSHVFNGCNTLRFNVTSGIKYIFKTGCGDNATADYDTELTLMDESCEYITSDNNSCESGRSKIEWTATYSGYVYLKIEGGYYGAYGNYTLAYLKEVTVMPPSNLYATPVSSSEISLVWENVENESGYYIYRAESLDGPYAFHDNTYANNSSYTDSNLPPNTQYCYKVFAYNSTGNSGFSPDDCATTYPTPDNLVVQDETIYDSESKCFDALNTITVAGSGTSVEVRNGGSATFIAGNKIIFEPGFLADEGSYCSAQITTTGDYCDSQQPLMEATPDSTQLTSGLNNDQMNSDDNVKFYPNPTTGLFTIHFMNNSASTDVWILNMQGNMVFEDNFTDKSRFNINLNAMPNGIYMVIVKTPSALVKQKIVKI